MYNRKQVKKAAKEAMHKNFGMALLATLIPGWILSAVATIGLIILIGPVVAPFLASVFAVGTAGMFLAIVRSEKVAFGDMFSGFKKFGTNLLAGILVGLFTTLWSWLFVIPGIIKSFSYSMTYYILADHPEMSALDAITASRKMMKGHKWSLFILQLSFFWWHVLGVITFGLAYIYITPYIETATANFYNTIKEEQF